MQPKNKSTGPVKLCKLSPPKKTTSRKNKDAELAKDEKWALVDGGSGAHAANAAKHFPDHKVHETAASRAGGMFVAADGRKIPNRGEQRVKVQVETGDNCLVVFNDAPVTDPILCVAQLNDSGHDVMYQKRGGYIEHLKTWLRVRMYRREGVYWIKLKIHSPSEDERESNIFNDRVLNHCFSTRKTTPMYVTHCCL